MKKDHRVIPSYLPEGENLKGGHPPLCDVCNLPVRKFGYKTEKLIFPIAYPPWNSGWDGRCEQCGNEFKRIIQPIRNFDAVSHRIIELRTDNHAFQYFMDEAIVYAGIEIKVRERTPGLKEEHTSKCFLSLDELEALIGFIKENKVIMQQFHWLEDGA